MPNGEQHESASDAHRITRLLAAKHDTTISVVLPARNEEETVGAIVGSIRSTLMSNGDGLVDELIVMDDASTDHTADVARRAGADVVAVRDVLPDAGPGAGKGNVLWKSVAACHGDIIVWIDADLTSFDPGFVTGLIEPLLSDGSLSMVKGFYRRPEMSGAGGGRTTEIMARPLISTFFPHLAGIHQPLGGEYSARRSILEQLTFFEGYGVEIGLLIDIARTHGTDSIAQVDLGFRSHRVRPLRDLTAQAMEVLHAAVERAPGIQWDDRWESVLRRPGTEPTAVNTAHRPPLITCAGYPPDAHGR